MPPRRRKQPANPLGKDGKLQYPPKKTRKQIEAEQVQRKATSYEPSVPGIIDLEDLLTGRYHKRKKEEKMMKRKEIKMRKKFELMKWEGFPDESGKLAKLQAILPKHPDDQKELLIAQAEAEMNKYIRTKDVRRMKYYLTEGIAPHHIPPYDMEYIKIATGKLHPKYKFLKEYKSILWTHKNEIIKLYCEYMRRNILNYILKDPEEWKRLDFETFPAEYPVMVVRAPVPWHTQYCIASQFMEKHYFKGNIIIRKIRDLWFERYPSENEIPANRISK